MATETMAQTQRAERVEGQRPKRAEHQRPWPPPQKEWTLEDWQQLPDDGWRYEVIDGVLHMTPPPRTRHQIILAALFARMWFHVHQNQLGEVIPAPCAVQLPTQPVPVQPDLFFIRIERAGIIGETQVEGAPDLVVEILSPSNWLYDRREKFTLYQEAGVAEYWIVDPNLQQVEVFVLREGAYALLGRWGMGEEAHSETLTGFTIPLAGLFGE
jgi:Uma2 family endonuclease